MKLALDTPTDQLILGALRRDDRRRAASLVSETFAPRAFHLFWVATANGELAEELTYRAFALAMSELSTLRTAPTPGGWLMSRVQQVCREELFGSTEQEDDPAPGAPPPSAELRPTLEQLRAALSRLPTEDRAALALSGCCELLTSEPPAEDYQELAQRALLALRRALAVDDLSPSEQTLCELLVELRCPLPDGLQRRLAVLCAAL